MSCLVFVSIFCRLYLYFYDVFLIKDEIVLLDFKRDQVMCYHMIPMITTINARCFMVVGKRDYLAFAFASTNQQLKETSKEKKHLQV